MEVSTRKITRSDLAKSLNDHKTIVAFENLQTDVSNTGNALTTAGFIVTAADDNLGSERVLTASSNIDITDDGPGEPVILDLTDTGVTADTYGSTTRILIVGIDAKGRVTAVSEVKVDVSDVDGTLSAGHGGTGQASYTIGDLLFANGAASLSRLADVGTGNALLSGGVGVAPLWGKVGLTTHVSGILPEANGGTGTATAGFTGTVSPIISATFVNGKCTAAS